jgi:hypothetical protein
VVYVIYHAGTVKLAASGCLDILARVIYRLFLEMRRIIIVCYTRKDLVSMQCTGVVLALVHVASGG